MNGWRFQAWGEHFVTLVDFIQHLFQVVSWLNCLFTEILQWIRAHNSSSAPSFAAFGKAWRISFAAWYIFLTGLLSSTRSSTNCSDSSELKLKMWSFGWLSESSILLAMCCSMLLDSIHWVTFCLSQVWASTQFSLSSTCFWQLILLRRSLEDQNPWALQRS